MRTLFQTGITLLDWNPKKIGFGKSFRSMIANVWISFYEFLCLVLKLKVCAQAELMHDNDSLGNMIYRVHVVKPFNYDNPQIMVFLLDHGSYGMTDAAHLRPLRRMYIEKLPSQAYRAKLHCKLE
jgi:hypothetical protein